jgi:predicted ATPase
MRNLITKVSVRNFRSLAEVAVETGPLNVLFGPNGAGKSSFLDTIWFVRDCAIRSVELASSSRSHGIGILYDGATEADPISVTMTTDRVEYELLFGLSSGRIEPFCGERFFSFVRNQTLIDRPVGSDKASFFHANFGQALHQVPLREPEKLSLGRYLDFEDGVTEADEFDRLLHDVHFYHSRSLRLDMIKHKGSENNARVSVAGWGGNLWSVLRNLNDRRDRDDRYDTIMRYMSRCFPSFDGIVIEAVGATGVYGNFLEKGRRGEIRASGVSDGHLQMLFLLTSLFSEGKGRASIMLFDEPEVSLHPWALTVFAEAVRHATDSWNKQVFIATHSPVLLSQFDPEDVLTATVEDGRTQLRRLNQIEAIQDLLKDYAAGSLYMAEMIAPQSDPAEQASAGESR